ncbi:MAG: flagellar basal body P-ring protein FlgI [Halanaerobiales bacterium]
MISVIVTDSTTLDFNKLIKKKTIILLSIFILLCSFVTIEKINAASYEDPEVRIGDITRLEGARDNYLYGYGLVMGLAGTGDSRYDPTNETNANVLNRLDIEVTSEQINSNNVASVMVTADISVFDRPGDRIDITVSSVGDAESLRGGVLFMTPLTAANGEVYAVAQGPLVNGSFNVEQAGSSVSQGHGTVARIPEGAIVEKEVGFSFDREEIYLNIFPSNFETARNIALAVNRYFDALYAEEKLATPVDAGRVKVNIPDKYKDNVVDYVAKINNLEVRPGFEAKVVIDEKTGTIVMGHNVRISTTSVTTGNLTVSIESEHEVSQPSSLSEGETVTTEKAEITVEEGEGHMMVMPTGGSIEDLVSALNSAGAKPGDIINIIQALKRAGAIYAEVEII